MKIGVLSKIWDDHFIRAGFGIKEAAKELGVTVEYEGPKTPDSFRQKDILEKWLKKGVNAVVVSANDPNTLVPLMKKAQLAGVKTSTWNSDISDGREFFLNQTSNQSMGKCLVDMMSHSLNDPAGEYLVITSSLDAPNQNQWLREMKNYSKKKYSEIIYKNIIECNEVTKSAEELTYDYLEKNPNTKGIFCLTGNSTPGALKAVKKLALVDKIPVTGIGVQPKINTFLKEGSVKEVALWNPEDLGYGAVYLAKSQIDGKIYKYKGYVELGRLGKLKIESNNTIILGDPRIITFNRDTRNFVNYIDYKLNQISSFDNINSFFYQSATHYIICLIVMKYFYEDQELSKHNLLEKVGYYSKNLQSKTLTTESKYVDNAIHKGFLINTPSLSDHRKTLIQPSNQMINSLELDFAKHSSWFENKYFRK